MFRPIIFKPESEYQVILMRNRHEELIDIPIDYVDSIDFSMGTYIQEPTKINLTIPSHIDRNGKKIELPLYKLIKGKMQIKLIINNEYYFMFTIEEESVTETKDLNIKTIGAYERYYKFSSMDFIISTDVATRQLYKEANEKIEVSDGVLNWFEQQCNGWSVDVTDKARTEISNCSDTKRVDLSKVDKTITDEIFNQSVSISANEGKPLNMKLVMDCTVYDSTGKKATEQILDFKFNNLPYAIKRIKANYSSTNKHFYGITFTITYTNDHTSTHEYAFVNCKNVRLVANMAIEYELGNLRKHKVTKYRTFDTTVTTWMNFLEKIAETFDVIILFDSFNERIKVQHREEFGKYTNIALSYDNALTEITKQRKLDELVTRLTVENENTSIASVNVLGTDYVECYDYFIDNGIMSNELKNALDRYNTLLEQKNVEFNNLLTQKHNADQSLSLANSQLLSLQEKYTAEKSILTAFVKAFSDLQAKPEQDRNKTEISNTNTKIKNQQEIVTNLENQITTKLSEVQTCKDNANNLANQLVAIGEDIKKENTGYFTNDLLLELSDYLIERAITDDVHLTAIATYDYVVEKIREYQKPIIDFSINTSMEFIKRTGRNLNNCIFLGAKMEIEDKNKDITNDDGTVMLYGYSIVPKEDSVSNFRFTNGAKVPDTALKQISKATQTAKATKSMTDFYKSTLQKIKDINPDVAKIIEEGLDLAAQKVRSRTENNIIEIDEAGIFLIDANNENEQLALINDLIAMTTDRWETCRVAISPEGIMAEELIGKIILGEQLYLGNETNSFKIALDEDPATGKTAYGMFIYSKDKNDANTSHLRVFLGIDKNDNPQLIFFDQGLTDMDDFHNSNSDAYKDALRVFLGVNNNNQTIFNMYSGTDSNGNNELVASSNGMFSCYQISDRDSFDYTHSFKSYFYVPSTLEKTFEAKIIVHLDNFRAYSKSANSKTVDLSTTETTSFEAKSTTSGKDNISTTETKSFEAKSTTSGKDNITTTETKSFEAKSTAGSGTIPVSMSVSLSGLSGSAQDTSVSGSGSASTSVYGEGGGGFSTRSTGTPYGQQGATTDVNNFGQHYHIINFSHGHSVNVSCGSHKHTISVSGKASGSASADSHTHNFTTPTHSHNITLPGHTHNFTVPTHSHNITLPGHTHNFTVPTHSHSIKMPSHNHDLIYGVYEHNSIPACKVYIDGKTDLGINMSKEETYQKDITDVFKNLTPGFHYVEIKTTSSSGLARASFTLFWSGYFAYKS